jgi:arylsulfatase A-like enzyme
LFTALRAAGRDRDTLIIFTSDHGPMHTHESCRMLRGGKADLYEGGLRVPLIMRWPEEIAEGRRSDALVSGVDLFPTLLTAAGLPARETIDGLDLWPVIRGPGAQWRDTLCWHYPHYHHLGLGPCSAILSSHDKLIEWFDPRPRIELFRLTADPGERNDLSVTRRDRRDDLLLTLHEWRDEVGAQEMRRNPNFDPNVLTEILPPLSDPISPPR